MRETARIRFAASRRRLALRASVPAVVLLCCGCSPRPQIELFNQSHQVVTVVSGPDQEASAIEPGGRCVFWFEEQIRIRTSDLVRTYRLPSRLRYPDSDEFAEFRPLSRRVLKMQVDARGLIHLLPAGASAALEVPYKHQ